MAQNNNYVDSILDTDGQTVALRDSSLAERVEALEQNQGKQDGPSSGGGINQAQLDMIASNVEAVAQKYNDLLDKLATLAYKDSASVPESITLPMTWPDGTETPDPVLAPSISISVASPFAVGLIADGDESVSREFALSGNNLTDAVQLSVEGTGFAVSPTVISAADANSGNVTVTVTYDGEADEATGRLSMWSGKAFASLELSAGRTIAGETTYDVIQHLTNCVLSNPGPVNAGYGYQAALSPSPGYTLAETSEPVVLMGGYELDLSAASGNRLYYDAQHDSYIIKIVSVTGDVDITAVSKKVYSISYHLTGCAKTAESPTSVISQGDATIRIVPNTGYTLQGGSSPVVTGASSTMHYASVGDGYWEIILRNVSSDVDITLAARSSSVDPDEPVEPSEVPVHAYGQEIDSNVDTIEDEVNNFNLHFNSRSQYRFNSRYNNYSEENLVLSDDGDFTVVVKGYAPSHWKNSNNLDQSDANNQIAILFNEKDQAVATSYDISHYSTSVGQFMVGIRPSVNYSANCYPYILYKSGSNITKYFKEGTAVTFDNGVDPYEPYTVAFVYSKADQTMTAYVNGELNQVTVNDVAVDALPLEVPLSVRGVSIRQRCASEVSGNAVTPFTYERVELYDRALSAEEIAEL